jgi:hypothetical protein
VASIEGGYFSASAGGKNTQSRKWLVEINNVEKGVFLNRVERMPTIQKY